jgi:hypothetical protein
MTGTSVPISESTRVANCGAFNVTVWFLASANGVLPCPLLSDDGNAIIVMAPSQAASGNTCLAAYFTRRPLKNPAFVVFCLMLAVSPCSSVLSTFLVNDVSFFTSDSPPGPFGLRLAGGMGGISL